MRARAAAAVILLFSSLVACAGDPPGMEGDADDGATSTSESALAGLRAIPNGLPFLDATFPPPGLVATHSREGVVRLDSAYHQVQGSNGRTCGTCHFPDAAWSITPLQVKILFAATAGTHPLFNPLDANNPNDDVSTPAARRAAYSMLLKGLFRRGNTPDPATREFDIVEADDPHGWGTTSRIVVFRRSMPTANFHLANNVGWDGGFTVPGDMRQSLVNQARAIIGGALAGPTNADPAVLDDMVAFESSLSVAQVATFAAGRTDACGAKGGPERLSRQAFVAGRFDLFDAWASGTCSTHGGRAAVYRGQQIFNTKQSATGATCLGCHDAANNGSNTRGVLFDIGASDPRWRTPDMPLYTLKHKVTGEEIRTTDPGRANRTGRWADINRFKTTSLRGIAARPPYFHNGIAATLEDVVDFYEASLGFSFTRQEKADLVAFMNAL